MKPNIYSSIIKNYYNSHGMEATKELTNRQMDKECMYGMYVGILFSHKKRNFAI